MDVLHATLFKYIEYSLFKLQGLYNMRLPRFQIKYNLVRTYNNYLNSKVHIFFRMFIFYIITTASRNAPLIQKLFL